jgi:SAM-dependent methyltransferase
MKLNLGCGTDFRYEKDWVNLDLTPPANIIGDINEGLPFKAGSFDLVWASHILEHIPDLVKLQWDLARVIKPSGLLKMIVPHYLSPDAWGDPTHCRGFSRESFLAVYWLGFNPSEIEIRRLTKKPLKEGVDWIFAILRRNQVAFRDIDRSYKSRNYTKTAGVPWELGRE